MPTYEYACAVCGHQWEQVQRITEPPVELCPKCTQSSAHRLISGGTNFILKGGGWYSDLYASPKAPAKNSEGAPAATPESPAKSEGATKSDGKAPASPAPAPSPSPSPSSSSPSSSSPASTPS